MGWFKRMVSGNQTITFNSTGGTTTRTRIPKQPKALSESRSFNSHSGKSWVTRTRKSNGWTRRSRTKW